MGKYKKNTKKVAEKSEKISRKRGFPKSSSRVNGGIDDGIRARRSRSNIDRPEDDTASQPLCKKIKNENDLTVEHRRKMHDSSPLNTVYKIKNEFDTSPDATPRYARTVNNDSEQETEGEPLREKLKAEPGTEAENRYETGDSSRNNDPVACRRQCSTYELRKTDNDDQESDTPVAGTVKHDGENNCSGCESCDEAVSLVIVIEPENDVAADLQYDDSPPVNNDDATNNESLPYMSSKSRTAGDSQVYYADDREYVRDVQLERADDLTGHESACESRENTDDKPVLRGGDGIDLAAEVNQRSCTLIRKYVLSSCPQWRQYETGESSSHINDDEVYRKYQFLLDIKRNAIENSGQGNEDDRAVSRIIKEEIENDSATERRRQTTDDYSGPRDNENSLYTNTVQPFEEHDAKDDGTVQVKVELKRDDDWTGYESVYNGRQNMDDTPIGHGVVKDEYGIDSAAEQKTFGWSPLSSEVALTSYVCNGTLSYTTPAAKLAANDDVRENYAECRPVTVKEELDDNSPVHPQFLGVLLLYLAIKNSSREYVTYHQVETFIRRWFPYYAHESLLIAICSLFIHNKLYFTCENSRTADIYCSVWTVNEEYVDVLERELTYLVANHERALKSIMTDSDRLPGLLNGYGTFKLGYSPYIT